MSGITVERIATRKVKENQPISGPNQTESGTTAKTGNFDKRQAHVEQCNARSKSKLSIHNLLVMGEAYTRCFCHHPGK